MSNKKPISKDMQIGEIISKYPKVIPTLINHGLHCIGCHVATWETLEQGAAGHGINVKKLVKELNKKIKQNK